MSDSIPPRFRDVSFGSYIPQTDPQRLALKAVQKWLTKRGEGVMLALIGKQGTGKSHLLYSAANAILAEIEALDPKERVQRKVTYPFIAPWYRLADELRYGKSTKTESGYRQMDGAEVRTALWSRSVVMLDEVRPTSGTGFDDSELARFACHAYDNQTAVLITTNYHPLASVMGDAAASRFSQIVIDGPDARQEDLAA